MPIPRMAMMTRSLAKGLVSVGFMLAATLAMAQQRAGEVTHLQGMATAQQPAGEPRFLGRGDAVLEGDVISTTEKGFAIISLVDGTKFTLRPSTSFALTRYAHNQGSEMALMSLIKGGLRVVTGLIGKRNPSGVGITAGTATIGIRGTSFDARLCDDDCRQESASLANRPSKDAAVPPPPVVARVVEVSGKISANKKGQTPRPLSIGAPLYEGDEVRADTGAFAVVGFADQSKVSLNQGSVIRIEQFSYKTVQGKDSMVLALLKGGLRVVTGLIGKASPSNVAIATRTSTIGIRGTGMDISCEGPCVDASLGESQKPVPPTATPRQQDGLFMLTWDGTAFFASGPLDVSTNQAGFVGSDGQARLLRVTPEFMMKFIAPRPDQVNVNWDNLFSVSGSNGDNGLYVYVRDGHVIILADGSQVDLGVGESGFVGTSGKPQRIAPAPDFMLSDPFPIPEFFGQTDAPVLQLFGVTLGQPGQDICNL